MTHARTAVTMLLAAMLAACSSSTPLETTAPTVGFVYDGTQEGLATIEDQADDYCDDAYDRVPQLVRITHRRSDSVATFRCI